MIIYALRDFETYTYRTHTAFYASSMEMVKRLLPQFIDWLIDNIDIDDDSDEYFMVQAFQGHVNEDDIDRETIADNLLINCLKAVEIDSLLFNESQIDGD